MAARRRRRRRQWPIYVLAGAVLLTVAALTASTGLRVAAARWVLDVTAPRAEPGGGSGDPEAASDGSALRAAERDAAACARIAEAAGRYRDGELTLRGYRVEVRAAADAAVPDGAVRRHARASLDAIAERAPSAERRARERLVDACAAAAARSAR